MGLKIQSTRFKTWLAGELFVSVDVASIRGSVQQQRKFAVDLFRALEHGARGNPGVTRDTYGAGENFAHKLFAERAQTIDLEVSYDAAANTYATWKSPFPEAPKIVIGSHLDSVNQGGNFDGAAGVVAGLVAIAALRLAGFRPRCDITAMAVRAEESIWFQVSYIGSRAALGMLPANALDARRIDTKRTLASHLSDSGGDPVQLSCNRRSLDPAGLRAFLEVHIEQAPSLVEARLPIAICSGIPGNFRYPHIRIEGEHAHVGLPRRFRRDAVMAAVDLAAALDRIWEEYESSGATMACTLGRFYTDPDFHGLTNVPGLFHMSLDVRAYDAAQLVELEQRVLDTIKRVEAERSVRFDLGERASAPIGRIDPEIRRGFEEAAGLLRIPSMILGSPGSHDAAAFAEAGVPIGMLFVRNSNGSHNPHEAMEIDDLLEAVAVLTLWLATQMCEPPSTAAASSTGDLDARVGI